MMMRFFRVLSAVVVLLGTADSCSILNFRSMAIEERAREANWIVYGTVVGNRSQVTLNQTYTVTVQPLCWLRQGEANHFQLSNQGFPNITATEEAPCHFNDLVRGKNYILFLSRNESKFTVDDVNIETGAFEDPSDEIFGAVYRGVDAGLGAGEPNGECIAEEMIPCFTGEWDPEICGGRGGGVSVGVALWLLVSAVTSAAFVF